MPSPNLDALKTICQRISLNIPDHCPWRWDKEFDLALTVINSQDEIMIALPLTLEFAHTWDFMTINEADAPLRDFLQSGFGLVPGQKMYSSDSVQGVVLFIAWWPWGADDRISLRLGLIAETEQILTRAEARKLICEWLNLTVW
jgi:hypothetical protein